MNYTLVFQGQAVEYQLTYKSVKNINLRITAAGEIRISAPARVSRQQIEYFLKEKWEWIMRAKAQCDQKQKVDKDHLPDLYDRSVFNEILDEIFPLFQNHISCKPDLRFRYMTTRWGSCTPAKGKVTLNLYLLKTPLRCIRYVIFHEMVHFIHPNHSREFYMALERFLPTYREDKKLLEQQNLL